MPQPSLEEVGLAEVGLSLLHHRCLLGGPHQPPQAVHVHPGVPSHCVEPSIHVPRLSRPSIPPQKDPCPATPSTDTMILPLPPHSLIPGVTVSELFLKGPQRHTPALCLTSLTLMLLITCLTSERASVLFLPDF